MLATTTTPEVPNRGATAPRQIDLALRFAVVAAPLLFGLFTLLVYGKADLWLQAFIGALLGALVTVLVTYFLLDQQTKQQTDSQAALLQKQNEHQKELMKAQGQDEGNRERSAKVFEEKLRSYNDFLTVLEEVTRDGTLTADEVRRLVFQLGRLKMLSGDRNVAKIAELLTETFVKTLGQDPELLPLRSQHLQGQVLAIVRVFGRELSMESGDQEQLKMPAVTTTPEVWISDLMQMLDAAVNGTRASGDDEDAPAAVGLSTAMRGPTGDWTGEAAQIWYANTGGRSWADMCTAGYWTCGGRELYWKMAQKLQPGDDICAYMSGRGYVGLGVVQERLRPLDEFLEGVTGLSEETKATIERNRDRRPEDKEYAVRVKWSKVLGAEERRAWREDGTFASPMTLCRLKDAATLEMLRRALLA